MPGARQRFGWLWSQGLGVLCGQLTVLLLAVGSVVLVVSADGASRGVRMDDVRAFLFAPSWVHLWLYMLVPVLGLYALNTLLATWDSIARKWRLGIRSLPTYAAALMHVGFLLALLAHLVGGLWSREGGERLLDGTWRSLSDSRQARLVSFRTAALPSGMPRSVKALVELRDREGEVSTAELGYNNPLSFGWGRELYLYVDGGSVPVGVRVSGGDRACVLSVGDACTLVGERVALAQLVPASVPTSPAVALLEVGIATAAVRHFVIPGQELAFSGGVLRLIGFDLAPQVIVRSRTAAGNPLALLSALLLSLGVLLMWRRLV